MNWFINCYDAHYLYKICSIFIAKMQRKGIMDKSFNMVKGKEILLERQGDYYKLREIGYKLR